MPEWIAAIGTVGAFIAGGLLLRRDTDDRRRRDARGVSAWLDWGDAETRNGSFVVRNWGDVPVYDVIARTSLPGRTEQDFVRIDMLRPGEQREDDTGTMLDGCDAAQVGYNVGAELMFTDGSGHRWFRDTRGRLTRLRRWPDDGGKPLGEPTWWPSEGRRR